MKLTGETKLFLGIIIASVALIGGAVLLFSKPTPPAPTLSRQDLLPAGTPTKGNPDAKVFLVEFSDFQCPACKAAQPAVDAIITQYKDKMVFGYRYFPLDQHPFGLKSSLVAAAADQQGKFWEMHDALFANQEQFSDELFPKLAQQLHLNMDEFTKAVSDSSTSARVQKDVEYGNQIGVNSTPTFYLNGNKLTLTTYDDLKNAVAEAVK